jgi:O-antigen/teichoic acid export membrane protein
MLWSSLMLFGISGGDVIILGYFVSSEQAAYYFAASRTAMLISVSMVGINSIVAPMIAAAHKQNQPAQLEHVARLGARLSLTIAVFFTGLLFTGGEWVLSLFGRGYEDSFALLLVLLAGQLVNAAVGAVAFIMFMSGQERHAARILTLVISLMLLFYAIVVPEFGIRGAAAVTATGIAMWNLGLMLGIRRVQGVRTHADNLVRCAAFLFLAALYAVAKNWVDAPPIHAMLLYAVAMPVVLWKYVLLDDDREALLTVARRFRPAPGS